MWAPTTRGAEPRRSTRARSSASCAIFGPREQATRVRARRSGEFSDEEADAFLDDAPLRREPRRARGAPPHEQGDRRPGRPAGDARPDARSCTATDDEIVPVEVARYMAPRIPGARLVELPGVGHLAFGGDRSRDRSREIESFLKDVWETGAWEEPEPDRVLATVLFTDIVGSTAKAAELGDRGWRELLERHHELVRRELVRFRGARARHRGRRLLRHLRRTGARDPLCVRDRRRPCASSASRSAPACTPASARCVDGKVGGHRRPHRRAGRRAGAARRGARLEHGQGPRRRLGDSFRRARSRELKGFRANGTSSRSRKSRDV